VTFKGIGNGALYRPRTIFLLDFHCNHVSYFAPFLRYCHLFYKI